jgi:DNA-binding response OmpR family regulator
VHAHLAQHQVDLVVLDLMLRSVDALALTRELRAAGACP